MLVAAGRCRLPCEEQYLTTLLLVSFSHGPGLISFLMRRWFENASRLRVILLLLPVCLLWVQTSTPSSCRSEAPCDMQRIRMQTGHNSLFKSRSSTGTLLAKPAVHRRRCVEKHLQLACLLWWYEPSVACMNSFICCRTSA
jgi:hypothetical protein